MDVPPLSLRAGDLVDSKYRVEQSLGSGGLGTVYAAWDIHLERWVAIKSLHRGRATSIFGEAARLASVRHPNIVAIHGAGWHRGRPYLVMEHVLGTTLARALDSVAALPLSRKLEVLAQIAAALAAIHEAGLLHRDLKPENILIEALSQRVVLIDFGTACDIQRPPARLVGTPDFLAPECVGGQPPSMASDLYAWGVTAYEVLTRSNPFYALDSTEVLRRQVHARPAPPSAVDPRLHWCDSLVLQALEKRPADRPQSALGILAELRRTMALVDRHCSSEVFAEVEEPRQSAVHRRATPETVRLTLPRVAGR